MAISRTKQLFLLLSLIVALALSGCDWAVLDPQGPIGDQDKTILVDSVAIMLAIVVPTILANSCLRLVVSILQYKSDLSAGF